jgi:hypothetical protein
MNRYYGDSSGDVDCECDDLFDSVLVPAAPSLKECALLLNCPYGYKTDPYGQWICECAEDETHEVPVGPPEDCPALFCPHGFAMDDAGRLECRCLAAPVLVLPESPTEGPDDPCLMLNCPYGLKTDLEGVRICECAEAPLPAPTSAAPSLCPSMGSCPLTCAFGMRIDKNECQKCWCRKCPALDCHKKCAHGYRTNSHGCRICKCLGELLRTHEDKV